MNKHNKKECDDFIKKVMEKLCEIRKDFKNLSDEDKEFVSEVFKKYILMQMSLKQIDLF